MRALAAICVLLGLGCASVDGGSSASGPTDDGGAPANDDSSIKGVADGGACFTCSADLHSVLDCGGNLVTACPSGQGCGLNGACVSACDAASANKSAVGCEYYSAEANDDDVGLGNECFAAFVVNTWDSPVDLGVERGGTKLPVAKFAYVPAGSGLATTYAPLTGALPAGGVAILFLSSAKGACPAGTNVAVSTSTAIEGTGSGQAFRLTSSAPIAAYDIFPYGGGNSAVTSATLLLPTSVWDTNYVAVTGYETTIPSSPDLFPPWMAMVASQDDTKVTLRPTVMIRSGGGVPGTLKGQPRTYALNRGDVLKFEQGDDLTGTPLQSTKPIGVWGGHRCAYVPVGVQACDAMHQQIPPVRALGHEYAAVRYRNRLDGYEESPPWKLVGAVDGTLLTYDPPQVGAPASLGEGALLEFNASGPFTVRSQDAQHPFSFGAHMTGCQGLPGAGSGPQGCMGDPEFVNVVATGQYMTSYVFFTDPTYPETNLVFVRAKGADGSFKDVSLDCLGTLSGWKPVDGADAYEYTRTDLVRHAFTPQGKCDNGRHEAHSDAPFALTVWGWGSRESSPFFSEAVSYAYPAGASVKPINTVIVVPN